MKLTTKLELDYPEEDGKYYVILEETESLTGRKSNTMGMTKTQLKKFLSHNTCIGLRGIYPIFKNKITGEIDLQKAQNNLVAHLNWGLNR